jgi:hypothetical protein
MMANLKFRKTLKSVLHNAEDRIASALSEGGVDEGSEGGLIE